MSEKVPVIVPKDVFTNPDCKIKAVIKRNVPSDPVKNVQSITFSEPSVKETQEILTRGLLNESAIKNGFPIAYPTKVNRKICVRGLEKKPVDTIQTEKKNSFESGLWVELASDVHKYLLENYGQPCDIENLTHNLFKILDSNGKLKYCSLVDAPNGYFFFKHLNNIITVENNKLKQPVSKWELSLLENSLQEAKEQRLRTCLKVENKRSGLIDQHNRDYPEKFEFKNKFVLKGVDVK